jgi:hypothetical protein
VIEDGQLLGFDLPGAIAVHNSIAAAMAAKHPLPS